MRENVDSPANNPSDSPTATDDGAETNTEQGQQVRCSRCGRTRNVVHTAEAGTFAGDYFGLLGSSTVGVCHRCWSLIPEISTQYDDFDLLEFDGWERRITTNDSRFVSAVWQSDTHTIMLEATGDGEWTVSWFSKDEDSKKPEDWHSRYEVRQFALDQIQQMIRLIKAGIFSAGNSVEIEQREDEDAENSSTSGCDQCGTTEGTNWLVQSGTPAGRYLGLGDGETTELCDECMRKVSESIGGDDEENTRNESAKGGENER